MGRSPLNGLVGAEILERAVSVVVKAQSVWCCERETFALLER